MISSPLSIIPEPVNIFPKEGFFQLKKETIIYSDLSLLKIAEYLRDLIKPATGFNLIINEIPKEKDITNCIILKLLYNNFQIASEGYNLNIFPYKIEIESKTPNGSFYGIQTLRQLFPPEIDYSQKIDTVWKIPCVNINDYPRFSWRGFMLDEARHFFGKNIVKNILDIMSSLKLNTFHWHLTDDQGWRVEIKKYPLLTEIGSKRKSTKLYISKRKSDKIPHFGFYTQEDLKDIIKYARERYITIIPEIDLPGHTQALLASYPELSCTGGPFEVSSRFGISNEVLCIGKDSVLNFVKDVLKDIINIFPSEIIHIGGDEVPTKRWEKCEACQMRIKKENLNKERDLQVYFTEHITDFLYAQGRRPMGWNEILYRNLDKNTLCQYWLGDLNQVLDHLKDNRKFVMSKMDSVYLNYGYKNISLSKIYNYEPIPEILDKKYHTNILGIEACLWSEFIVNNNDLEYYTFPRLIAMAETGWILKEKRNFETFIRKLPRYLERLRYYNINYAKENEWILNILNSFFSKHLQQ